MPLNFLLISRCEQQWIEKIWCRAQHAGMVWGIDEFFGDNNGLFVAEVELTSVDQLF